MSSSGISDGGYWYGSDLNRHYRFNTDVLLTAVLCLAFVVVLVVVLHLYFRFVLQRQQRRRAADLQLHRQVLHPTQAELAVGLDPAVIASIASVAYAKPEASGGDECAICLTAIDAGEVVRVLPNCGHVFHVGCIDMWLRSHSTCPVCRAKAEPPPARDVVKIKVEPREAPVYGVEGAAALAAAGADQCRPCSNNGGTSASRLGSSFRRMMSMDRSGRRAGGPQADSAAEDLERQRG